MQMSSSVPRLLEVGHRRVYFEHVGKHEKAYATVFNVETSKKASELDVDVGSLGLFSKRQSEGGDLTYDRVSPGPDTTYVHEEWALGYQVTRINVEDDQWRIVNRFPALLADSGGETIERELASDWNNAFDVAYPGGDGKPLCSATHVQAGGGVFSNLLAAADFDVDALEDALIAVGSFVDGRGKKKALRIERLIHPLESEFAVAKTLNSTMLPGTDFNDVNPAKGKVTPFMYRYLTDPDCWFIQCAGHSMNVFMRRAMDFGRDNDFGTGNMRYQSTFRLSHGWSRAQEIFGSAGG